MEERMRRQSFNDLTTSNLNLWNTSKKEPVFMSAQKVKNEIKTFRKNPKQQHNMQFSQQSLCSSYSFFRYLRVLFGTTDIQKKIYIEKHK